MRVSLLVGALVLAGCASQPPGTLSEHDADAQRVALALKHGYKVTNQDGEVMYCRSDFATASHIQKNTVCLTAHQIDEIDLKNDQMLDSPNKGRSAGAGLPPMR